MDLGGVRWKHTPESIYIQAIESWNAYYFDPIKLVWGKDSDDPLPGVFPDFGVKKGISEDAVLFLHIRF